MAPALQRQTSHRCLSPWPNASTRNHEGDYRRKRNCSYRMAPINAWAVLVCICWTASANSQLHDTPQPANGKIINNSSGVRTGLISRRAAPARRARRSRQPSHEDMAWPLKAIEKSHSPVGATSIIDRSEGPVRV